MMMELQQKYSQRDILQRDVLELIQRIHPEEGSEYLQRGTTEDLGLDSLAKMELAGAIHKKFDVRLHDDEIASLCSLNDLIQVIERKQKNHPVKIAEPVTADSEHVSVKKSFLTKIIRAPIYRVLERFLKNRFQIETQGAEHLPIDRPYIIAANHSSHLDNPSLMIAGGHSFDQYTLLAAKDYFFERRSWNLFLVKFLFNLVPFDRNSEPSAMKNNIKWCKACIDANKNLIIFPESTRSLNGEMQPFKGGCALLAYSLKLPIIPAYIKGTYDCLPKGKSWPKKGCVTVRFGEPLFMEHYALPEADLKYQVYRKITQDLEQRIKKLGNL